MRLFVGIPLPGSAMDEIQSISTRFQSNKDGLRWSMPESWHITLQFLGSSSQHQYECILTRLRELRSPPVLINFDGMGFFDRAGIFFVGVHATPELIRFQRCVVEATGHCGFMPEDRPYRPHITLARGKGRAGGQAIEGLKTKIHPTHLTHFLASGFALYESFTQTTGSHYEIREHFYCVGN